MKRTMRGTFNNESRESKKVQMNSNKAGEKIKCVINSSNDDLLINGLKRRYI